MEDEAKLAWLKKINPRFKDQDWHSDNVKHPDRDIINRQFYYEVGREIKSISPKIICGIEYGDGYNDRKDINWLELFISLKRLNRVVRNFRTYEEIIKHIHYPHKDEKQVSQFGNHYFTSSGQHRLCLAKLLDVESVEVKIIKYNLDEERLNANKRMLS